MRRNKNNSNATGYIMLIPAGIFFLFINTIPFFYGLILSFTNRNYFKPNRRDFIGFQNYLQILAGANDFYRILAFTLIYTFGSVLLAYVVGMVFAVLLNRDIKFRNLFRALALLPWLIPSVVAAVNWQWLLNDRLGFINNVLVTLGIVNKPILFLADPLLAQVTVIVVAVWKSYPFMMVTLLGGMQAIDKTLYDPAEIDGANGWQKFYYITFPLIKPISLVAISLQCIWTFNTTSFDNIYLLTNGGPVNSTYVLSIETYYAAFYRGNIGYASALSLLMTVLIGIAITFYFYARKRNSQSRI